MRKLALFRLRSASQAQGEGWELDESLPLGSVCLAADGFTLDCPDSRWYSWIYSLLDRPSLRFVGGGADGLECLPRDSAAGLEILLEHLYEGGVGVKGLD